jgi:preprotein translocase subunit SecB
MEVNFPIQLVDYVIEEFQFNAHPAFRDGGPDVIEQLNPSKRALSLDIGWTFAEEDSDADQGTASGAESLLVYFTVGVNESEDWKKESMYSIRLKLVGLVRRAALERVIQGNEELTEAEYLYHTITHAIADLYGSARTVIVSMTAQGPYQKMTLPSIAAEGIARQVIKAQKEPAGTEQGGTDTGASEDE